MPVFDTLFPLFPQLQVRIETDPADRTQLRVTIASGDPTLTFEYVYDNPRLQLTFGFATQADSYNLCCAG